MPSLSLSYLSGQPGSKNSHAHGSINSHCKGPSLDSRKSTNYIVAYRQDFRVRKGSAFNNMCLASCFLPSGCPAILGDFEGKGAVSSPTAPLHMHLAFCKRQTTLKQEFAFRVCGSRLRMGRGVFCLAPSRVAPAQVAGRSVGLLVACLLAWLAGQAVG